MEIITLQLSIDSILAQANSAFEGLLGGAMDMVSTITESMTSLF